MTLAAAAGAQPGTWAHSAREGRESLWRKQSFSELTVWYSVLCIETQAETQRSRHVGDGADMCHDTDIFYLLPFKHLLRSVLCKKITKCESGSRRFMLKGIFSCIVISILNIVKHRLHICIRGSPCQVILGYRETGETPCETQHQEQWSSDNHFFQGTTRFDQLENVASSQTSITLKSSLIKKTLQALLCNE